MPKKPKPPDSSESILFRNAPTSAKTLLKAAHSGARLRVREEWWEQNKLNGGGKETRG